MPKIYYMEDVNQSSSYVSPISNPQSDINDKLQEPKSGATQYRCKICDHPPFKQQSQYASHLQNNHNQATSRYRKHTCKICAKKFDSYYIMNEHRGKQHPQYKNSVLYCQTCQRSKKRCQCINNKKVKCPIQGCESLMLQRYLSRHARQIHKIKSGYRFPQKMVNEGQNQQKLQQSGIQSEQISPKSEQNSQDKCKSVCEPIKSVQQVKQRMTAEPVKLIGGVDMETIKQIIEDVFKMRDIGFDPRYLKELLEAKQKQSLVGDSKSKP